MKTITRLSVLSLTLLASSVAYAAGAGTAELKVTGVIKPAACSPSFTGGSTVDYGNIPVSTLNQNAVTVLAEKTVPFSVSCDAAVKFKVAATDNRQTSAAANAGTAVWGATFGLGTVGGKNVGAYVLKVKPDSFIADGAAVDSIYENAIGSGTYSKSDTGIFTGSGGYAKAFAVPGTLVPGSYKIVTGTLAVQAVIDKTSNLNLSGDVPLDGSATIQITYL